MRRLLVLALAAGVVSLAAAVVLLRPGLSSAGLDKQAPEQAKAQGSAALPVDRVILYSSGVGYFERAGKVQGTSRVDLSFNAQDINDLLKSLVLRDMGGGHVSAVSYDSHDPVDKALQSFAIDLHTNPSLSDILNQARGEKVEAVLQQSNTTQPGTLTGSIVGVEKQKQPAGKDTTVEVELLNLWCAEGMRTVKLSEVQRLRFLNPALEGEVRKALEVLAQGHDAQKKAVSLLFAGEGEREVRVGYVVEAPIWKTSYRLVLGKDGKPYLQGWAIVENPSDEDWNSVGMALVSGRPISFRMDLYQPLYVPRPLIEPELFASLRPPSFNGAMENGKASGVTDLSAGKEMLNRARSEAKGADRNFRDGYFREEQAKQVREVERLSDEMDLKQGVQNAATAGQLGDFFQYVLDEPVSLSRQKSALLPVVNKDVEGQRVSIYNQATHPKFPLLGLRFKNGTGLHLMQGPITVFEGSSYAGDARLPDLAPGEDRLLAYAVDLETEVETVVENPQQNLTKVKIQKGILYSTSRRIESKTYKAVNRSGQDRTLLIEHPYRPEFRLTSKDEPAERARDVYRFQVKLCAGKSASETVTEERDLGSQLVLTNSDDNNIRVFLQSNVTSEAAKQALQKALELKGKGDLTRQDVAHAQQQLADIEKDQARLRANLKETPPTAEAYKKYLAKLDAQEGTIDELTARIKQLQDQELTQRKEYEAYLANLNVE